MIHFKKENGKVCKYNITYNKLELEEILKKLIMNTSTIRCKEVTTDYPDYVYGNKYAFDIKEKNFGKKEYFEEDRNIYKINYKEYKLSKLSELLIQFLKKEDMNLLNYLNQTNDIKTPQEIIQNEILESKRNANDAINDLNGIALKIESEKLKFLKEEIKLNENQKSEKEYYDELKKCFSIELIDEIDLEIFNRVKEFENTDIKKLIKSISK